MGIVCRGRKNGRNGTEIKFHPGDFFTWGCELGFKVLRGGNPWVNERTQIFRSTPRIRTDRKSAQDTEGKQIERQLIALFTIAPQSRRSSADSTFQEWNAGTVA